MNNDSDPDYLQIPVRLASGQLAQITEGVVQVVAPKPVGAHHFRMACEHRHSGAVEVHSADYDSLVSFLKQLERLDFILLSLERQPGEAPHLQA